MDGVIILQEHISGSQVPVDHPVLLQVIHTLTGKNKNAFKGLSCQWNTPNNVHICKKNKDYYTHLCDLNTPVEQPLWAELVLVVFDVLQQGALAAELGDKLEAGTGTDTQDPDNVNVVQASHHHHVLQ